MIDPGSFVHDNNDDNNNDNDDASKISAIASRHRWKGLDDDGNNWIGIGLVSVPILGDDDSKLVTEKYSYFWHQFLFDVVIIGIDCIVLNGILIHKRKASLGDPDWLFAIPNG